jgi:hypothetical protein
MMKFDVEYTDTFGGETNYAWCERAVIEAPDNASDRTIQKRARKAMGLVGVRGEWDNYGDMLKFKPYRCCTVMFVTPALEAA